MLAEMMPFMPQNVPNVPCKLGQGKSLTFSQWKSCITVPLLSDSAYWSAYQFNPALLLHLTCLETLFRADTSSTPGFVPISL